MKKGITFLSVMVAVVALAIITATLVISVPNVMQSSKLRSFATELMEVQLKVQSLNGNYSEYIINDIVVDISDLTDKSMFEGIITDNKVSLQQLNLEALGLNQTVYGKSKTPKDIYCVSEKNNVVYYLEGFETPDAKYYALNSDLMNMVSSKEDLTDNVGTNIVFIPSTYVKTRNGIKVTVKVPTVATNVSIKTSGEISPAVSNATAAGNYKQYLVNSSSAKGNYTIAVSYTINGENKTASYNVEEYMGVYAILYSDGELRINNDRKVDQYKLLEGNTIVMQTADLTGVWGYNGWADYRNQMKVVTFENEVEPKMPEYWFYACSNLVAVNNLHFLNLNSAKSMSCMFYGCSKLEKIDVSDLDVSKITNISLMFTNCNKLKELDVSKWNTSSVTNMEGVFIGCSSLTKLDVSQWDTKNVTSMARMFENVWGITELDLSNWDTSNVTKMNAMFRMVSVSHLDLTNFDTSSVTAMNQMFFSCSKLKNLDLSAFNTAKVSSMEQMFYQCSSLESINLSSFDTSEVTSMYQMFHMCSKLQEINVSNFKIPKVNNIENMFTECGALKVINASGMAESNITSLRKMFSGCNMLETVYLTNLKTDSVTNAEMMFYPCSQIKFIDMRNASLSQISVYTQIFSYFSNKLTIVVKDQANREIMQKMASDNAAASMSNVTILTAEEYEASL